MKDFKDEILAGEPRYRIRDKNGNIILDDISFEMITEIIQESTPLNHAELEDLQKRIYDEIFRASVSYATTISLSGDAGTQTSEIETDGSRFVILTRNGSFGNRTTNSVMLYDCLEGKYIFYIDFATAPYNNMPYYKANGYPSNLGMYASQAYTYDCTLNVTFNAETNKIKITNTPSGNSITGTITIKCYTNIGGMLP